jgi:serine/threonine protein kinase
LTPGSIVADKYRLISLIGRGGMGSVWRAEHLAWRSPVAVKLMDRATGATAEALARFQGEARLAASLRSAHVVQVIDDGRDAISGAPFIVMELLAGESLAQRLARTKRLAPAETARIITHVSRALSLAHGVHMVHRDLKPDNIFLVPNDDEEVAKVLDFGIAKWSAESEGGAPTATGTVIGTPYYMSPEQISDSKRVDHRSDLWSLGAIAYECLTGHRPFQADSLLALALMICSERPPIPSSLARVPTGFDAWFERATARLPADRFQSARELATELRRICGLGSSSSLEAQEVPDAGADPDGPGPALSKTPETATFQALDAHPKSVSAVSQTPAVRRGSPLDWRLKIAAVAVALVLLLLGPCLLLHESPPAESGQKSANEPIRPPPPASDAKKGGSSTPVAPAEPSPTSSPRIAPVPDLPPTTAPETPPPTAPESPPPANVEQTRSPKPREAPTTPPPRVPVRPKPSEPEKPPKKRLPLEYRK